MRAIAASLVFGAAIVAAAAILASSWPQPLPPSVPPEREPYLFQATAYGVTRLNRFTGEIIACGDGDCVMVAPAGDYAVWADKRKKAAEKKKGAAP